MATIAEENRKTLRQALTVQCGLQETGETPTSITALGAVSAYDGLANIEPAMLTTQLMDLAGDGFLNDGNAEPMQTDSDSYRYGYISEDVAGADGSFSTPFGFTITAAKRWDIITVEVTGQYGERRMLQINPVWSGLTTTFYIEDWVPGSRAYITAIMLGKAWIWNSEDLIGAILDLRSVSTEIGGELEVSSIEIQAYEPTDYTDIIGRIPVGAPIWYAAGYGGDMPERRNFYLSETISWKDNTLTVRGQDASMLLEDEEVAVFVNNWGGDTNVDSVIAFRVREALETISYDTVGSVPVIGIAGPAEVKYDAKAARSIISEYTGIFRDPNSLRMTYVDAGRPTLYFGNNGARWTIYADEISEMDVVVEKNKGELRIVLPEYYLQYNASIEEVEATAGKTYFVELDPPVPFSNVWISPNPSSYSEITCGRLKFKAAASTTYTISGYETFEELANKDNPYKASNGEAGETYRFDFDMPLFVMPGGDSLTEQEVDGLLDRSNIRYEFTYRGNPHIQPRDVLGVEIVTWEEVQETVSGLYPDATLYPGTTRYPDGEYKTVRRMIRRWETMTVDSITLEHSEGGGLTSKIIARKGAV